MVSEKACYLILMSSGLDSTAAFVKLINDKNLNDALIFPAYIWWRTKFIKVINKEYSNCIKIVNFIENKYKNRNLHITKVKKIEIPLKYYEDIREDFINNGRSDYWCHYRNAIFIFSSLSYFLNFLQLENITKYNKIIISTGFLGNLVDEDKDFVKNMKTMINNSLKKPNPYTINLLKDIDFYHPYMNNYNNIYFDIRDYGCWDILKYTWSCWRNDEKPCYDCTGCNDRKIKYDIFINKDKNLEDPFFNYY